MREESRSFTTGMFRNLEYIVNNYFHSSQGLLFYDFFNGTPVYWRKFLIEVLAIIKQVGCPTFFTKLACADLAETILNLNLSAEDKNV